MEKDIVPADQVLPNTLRVLPLSGKPVFPGIFTPMIIRSEEELKVVDEALSGDKYLALLLLKQEDTENPSPEDFFRVGTVAKIIKSLNLPDGGKNIFISTVKRFKVSISSSICNGLGR